MRSGRALTVQSMDIQLHATEYGSGETLILLHGNGEDSSFCAGQIPLLARRFRVIALDTRGHGASPRGTAPFTLEQFADDLADFMNNWSIGAAHLLGFSDGANIAMIFALRWPQRVKSLVLAGGNLFPEGLTDEVRTEDEAAWQIALREGDERTLELLRLMRDEPHIDPVRLAELDIPTLVVAGTHDMICEEHTRLIAESIPGAQLRFIEGSHFVAAEDPAAFNRLLDEFYTSCL